MSAETDKLASDKLHIEALTSALTEIAHLRPAGDIATAKHTRHLVQQMERIALRALARARPTTTGES